MVCNMMVLFLQSTILANWCHHLCASPYAGCTPITLSSATGHQLTSVKEIEKKIAVIIGIKKFSK